ncbi:MAG TPA: rhodanese-like domain-containing protein [Bacteroidales bacterium]|nr:rhodanese-like domain-containing protein [Bacteroidales bacterium]HOX75338.1 rhodanese-like domain-containing protein [Bacteroidales bacterium]HQM70757.1 rhodanese-like domain-containing protein [Bacteroidales bacterium]
MRLLAIFVSLLVSGSALIQAQIPDSSRYLSLEPYDFHLRYLRADSAILIDVREFFEYRGNRIKDAVNIPSSGNLEISADTIDKKFALFFYCSIDYRSKRVAEFFQEKGFKKLYNLDGGIVAWKRDGFPVEKKKVRRKR